MLTNYVSNRYPGCEVLVEKGDGYSKAVTVATPNGKIRFVHPIQTADWDSEQQQLHVVAMRFALMRMRDKGLPHTPGSLVQTPNGLIFQCAAPEQTLNDMMKQEPHRCTEVLGTMLTNLYRFIRSEITLPKAGISAGLNNFGWMNGQLVYIPPALPFIQSGSSLYAGYPQTAAIGQKKQRALYFSMPGIIRQIYIQLLWQFPELEEPFFVALGSVLGGKLRNNIEQLRSQKDWNIFHLSASERHAAISGLAATSQLTLLSLAARITPCDNQRPELYRQFSSLLDTRLQPDGTDDYPARFETARQRVLRMM